MALITSENRAAWQKLADDLGPGRPTVGKTVKVIAGKYTGETGKVFWFGPDKFASTRYCTDAQLALREIEGKRGFRVGIETANGRIFVPGQNVEVVQVEQLEPAPARPEVKKFTAEASELGWTKTPKSFIRDGFIFRLFDYKMNDEGEITSWHFVASDDQGDKIAQMEVYND